MSPNFIAGSYIDHKVCDEVIEYFEENTDHQYAGVLGCGLVPEWKDSTDMQIHPLISDRRMKAYLDALESVCEGYIKQFPWASMDHGYWRLNESFNIQKYLPGQGFHKWHTERNCTNGTNPFRHLVFMTYLNDVTDGGETEFYHQEIKVRPEKGLTLIWPSDWTHVHRGIISKTQTKYITTGWYGYDTDRQNYDESNKESVR
jgi:hypothetical protein